MRLHVMAGKENVEMHGRQLVLVPLPEQGLSAPLGIPLRPQCKCYPRLPNVVVAFLICCTTALYMD